VKEGHLHFSRMIGNGDGEDAGVLVIQMDEINALVGFKPGQSEPLPVEFPWVDLPPGVKFPTCSSLYFTSLVFPTIHSALVQFDCA
jgi:hypothetical protein